MNPENSDSSDRQQIIEPLEDEEINELDDQNQSLKEKILLLVSANERLNSVIQNKEIENIALQHQLTNFKNTSIPIHKEDSFKDQEGPIESDTINIPETEKLAVSLEIRYAENETLKQRVNEIEKAISETFEDQAFSNIPNKEIEGIVDSVSEMKKEIDSLGSKILELERELKRKSIMNRRTLHEEPENILYQINESSEENPFAHELQRLNNLVEEREREIEGLREKIADLEKQKEIINEVPLSDETLLEQVESLKLDNEKFRIEKEQYQRLNATLEEKLKKFEEEIKYGRESKIKLEKSYNVVSVKMSELRHQNEIQSKDLKDRDQTIKDLKESISKLEKEKSSGFKFNFSLKNFWKGDKNDHSSKDYESACLFLENKINELMAEKTKIEENVIEKQIELESKKKENNDLMKKIEQMNSEDKERSQNFKNLNEAYSILETKIVGIVSENEGLQEDISNKSSIIDSLNSKVLELEKMIEQSNKISYEELASSNIELKSKVSNLMSEHEKATMSLHEKNKQIEHLTGRVRELERDLMITSKSETNILKANDKTQHGNRDVEAANLILQNKISDMVIENKTLSENLHGKQKEIDTLKQRIEELTDTHLEEKSLKNVLYEEKISLLRHESDLMILKIDKLDRELHNLRAERIELESKIEELLYENKRLNDSVEERSQENDSYRSKILNLESKITKLEQNSSNLMSIIDSKNSEIDSLRARISETQVDPNKDIEEISIQKITSGNDSEPEVIGDQSSDEETDHKNKKENSNDN